MALFVYINRYKECIIPEKRPITSDCIEIADKIEVLGGEQMAMSFGRNPDNDVCIDNFIVSGKHCILQNSNNQLIIKSFGIAGTEYYNYEEQNCEPLDTEGRTVISDQVHTLILASRIRIDIAYLKKENSKLKELETGFFPHNILINRIFDDFKICKLVPAKSKYHIFEAEQISLGRKIVIKTMKKSVDISNKIAKKFLKNAEIASQFSHPQLVTIYKKGNLCFNQNQKIYNIPYIAMEYVDGESLDKYLYVENNGPKKYMQEQDAYSLMQEIAQVVKYMHSKSILHRNICPSNIILDKEGKLKKIIGFSLLKDINPDELANITIMDNSDSICGIPKGIFGFASPEAIYGDAQDIRSDIYSLGAVFYYCLCGLSFLAEEGYDSTKNIFSKIEDPLSIKKRNPIISSITDLIIMKCLKHEKEDRYKEIKDFINDLGERNNREQNLTFYGLFPDMHHVLEKLEVYAGYNPYEEIGGDFYTYKKINNDKFFFAMGDWRGHGSSVSVLVGLAIGSLNTIVEYEEKPDKILSLLHNVISPSIERGMFAEVICGIVDIKSKSIQYSQAGRIPLIHISKSTKKIHIYQESPLECTFVGTTSNFKSQCNTLSFEYQDKIMCLTDGIFELQRSIVDQRNEMYEFFSLETLVELVDEDNLQNVVEGVFNAADEFSNYIRTDDRTAICIKIKNI